MEFLIEHKEIGYIIAGAIIGSLLPKAKVRFLGKKVREKLPTKTAIMIADLIDEFEQGLRNKEFKGNKNIISNEQLSEETKKLKINMGLEK